MSPASESSQSRRQIRVAPAHKPRPATARSARALADALTPLQARAVREIVAYVRRENFSTGQHLAESHLAEQLGTSRSPINIALRHLVERRIVMHDLNRGYFLDAGAEALATFAQQMATEPDDPLYLKIGEDRLTRRLADTVNETDLMRLYGVSRNDVRKALSRIQQEGWIEKAAGYGWRFQAMIDSADAYEDSYLFRAAVEPVGLLSGRFAADPEELAAIRRQQEFIRASGYRTMTVVELFESNSTFHEALARWSGNSFVLQAVRRTNQLRRLVEYHQASKRGPRQAQAQEHLAILDAVCKHDFLRAAALMRSHLEGARRKKVIGAGAFTPTSPPAGGK